MIDAAKLRALAQAVEGLPGILDANDFNEWCPENAAYLAAAANALPELLDERDRLRAALLECMSCMDSLRDFVAEGGSIRMIGARDAVLAADSALDWAHAVIG